MESDILSQQRSKIGMIASIINLCFGILIIIGITYSEKNQEFYSGFINAIRVNSIIISFLDSIVVVWRGSIPGVFSNL